MDFDSTLVQVEALDKLAVFAFKGRVEAELCLKEIRELTARW